MSAVVFVEVDGERIVDWTRYSVDSDLLTPADGFSLEVAVPGKEATRRRLREVLAPGREVRFYVGNVRDGAVRDRFLQMSGIIDERRIEADRDAGTVFVVDGRDLAGHLTDASVALDIDVSMDMRLVELVRAAVAPYGLEVVTDSYAAQRTLQGQGSSAEAARRAGVAPERYTLTAQAEAERTGRPLDETVGTDPNFLANAISTIQARRAARVGYANAMSPSDVTRLNVRDARPQIGETVWAFCSRHASRLGVLMWLSPDGRLILSSPRYRQTPGYRLVRRYVNDPADPNNVRTGSLIESIGDRHSEVVVYGRGNVRRPERMSVVGRATDDAWPSSRPKPLYMQETSIRSSEAAARKALRELMSNKRSAFQLDYLVDDHGQRGRLFAVDTTVAVVDEVLGINGTFYVTKRTFEKDRPAGTSTRIRAVPPGSLVF